MYAWLVKKITIAALVANFMVSFPTIIPTRDSVGKFKRSKKIFLTERLKINANMRFVDRGFNLIRVKKDSMCRVNIDDAADFIPSKTSPEVTPITQMQWSWHLASAEFCVSMQDLAT